MRRDLLRTDAGAAGFHNRTVFALFTTGVQ